MGLRKNRTETIASVILLAGLCFIFLNKHITWIVRRLRPEQIQRDLLFHPDSHPMTGFKVTLMIFGWVFFAVGTYLLVYQTLKKKSKERR